MRDDNIWQMIMLLDMEKAGKKITYCLKQSPTLGRDQRLVQAHQNLMVEITRAERERRERGREPV